MRTDIKFKNYTDDEYDALCGFLIALNEKDDSHINWNWARLEWMIEHPEFDKSLKTIPVLEWQSVMKIPLR